MSTEIGTINGTYHKHVSASYEITLGPAQLHVTRFWGGKKKIGRMIQITISTPETTSYIHLTKKRTEKLTDILLNCFDDTKYPSE